MKNKSLFISTKFLILFIVLFCACQKDPFEGIESHERSITTFNIGEGQIGVADVNRAERHVTVYVQEGTDVSNVRPVVVPSYKASLSPASGDPVNFEANGNEMTYTVISESGRTQDWTIEIKPYEFDLAGAWKVTAVHYTYHVAPSEPWGWSGTKELASYLSDVENLFDDTFEFSLESVTPEGNLTGPLLHNLGEDGEAVDYVYDAAEPYTDMNHKFNKLPKGDGTWTMNFETGTLVFNDGESDETQSLPLEWNEDKNVLTLPFDPGPSDHSGGDDWNKGEIQYSTKFWYVFERVE